MTESKKITIYALDRPKLTVSMLNKLPASYKFIALFGGGDTASASKKNAEGKWVDIRNGPIYFGEKNYSDKQLCDVYNGLWETKFFNDYVILFTKTESEFDDAVKYITKGKVDKIELIPIVMLRGTKITARKTARKSRRTTVRKPAKKTCNCMRY